MDIEAEDQNSAHQVAADETSTLSRSRIAGEILHHALRDTGPLAERSQQRDDLWIVLWQTITTTHDTWITPLNSRARILVTPEHADAELLAAWEWLAANESWARSMGPVELYKKLRGVATKSYRGSARSANADNRCGMTNAPGDRWITVGRGSEIERCAS